MDKIHFNKLWYIGRLKCLEGKLKQLPDIRVGKHGQNKVLRYTENGKTKEINSNSPKWAHINNSHQIKLRYEEEYKRLLSEWNLYFDDCYENVKSLYVVKPLSTRFTTEFWNQLVDDECPAEKTGNFYYDNHRFRSRIEMQEAIVLRSMGLTYKYDSCVYRTDVIGFTDFSILLEEFGCTVFLEVMGDLETEDNIIRNTRKFRAYAENGYLIGRDWFIQGSTKHYMPNYDNMREQLVYIVNTIANLCVMKKSF